MYQLLVLVVALELYAGTKLLSFIAFMWNVAIELYTTGNYTVPLDDTVVYSGRGECCDKQYFTYFKVISVNSIKAKIHVTFQCAEHKDGKKHYIRMSFPDFDLPLSSKLLVRDGKFIRVVPAYPESFTGGSQNLKLVGHLPLIEDAQPDIENGHWIRPSVIAPNDSVTIDYVPGRYSKGVTEIWTVQAWCTAGSILEQKTT